MLSKQSWNNIPLPLKDLSQMLCDAIRAQDLHQWERKSVINERF